VTVLLALTTSFALAADGAEISRSKGKRDGVVVLWPRVVPATDDPAIADLAGRLQERLVDRRPAPERVCPQAGCRSASLGLMLGHREGGCVAVAIVGPPGPEPQALVPIAGNFQMIDPTLAFRTAPEQKLIVSEFVPCDQLEASFDPSIAAQALRDRLTAPR
jgi:hypothetical protein